MRSSPVREHARTSRGDREKEREPCDFSLYWMKSWGRLRCRCLRFLYKQSLHAVNSTISRLLFTFRRQPSSPFIVSWKRPMSLWAIFFFLFFCLDNKSIRSDRRCVLWGFQVTHPSVGLFSAEKRGAARQQTCFRLFSVAPLPHFHTSGVFFPPRADHTQTRATMAAVTSPETSPQPRVYFQTPAGTTEEPETPVRKQGRVTVKYDRKELRKRLNLEEWIIDQLTDLYDCEVAIDPNNNRPRSRSNVSIRRLC